jgi:hypothetical protein
MAAVQKTTILATVTIICELDPDKPQLPGQPIIRIRRAEWFKDDESMKGVGAVLMQFGKTLYEAASPITIVPAGSGFD